MTQQSILWRRLDVPGHESARVSFEDPGWHLAGTAVFVHESQACRLGYSLTCDSRWQTLSARVEGWVGNQAIEIEVSVDPERRWRINDQAIEVVTGCIDIDLNFSPSTNLLPIRRLNLSTGQEAKVRAAWLRFPSFKLEPLEQIYRRVGANQYQYESAGGTFKTELTVNEAGFVTKYPDFWKAL